MKTTIFAATYHNNPLFLEMQVNSLNKYIKDSFDFIAFIDADETTKCLFSQGSALDEIRRECDRLGVRYIVVPHDIHATISRGGLVPDGLPAQHPTERHRATLHWIFKNHKDFGFCEYDYFALLESDMFFTKQIAIREYMGDSDIIAPMRNNVYLKREYNNPNQYWAERIMDMGEITISFSSMYCFFVNMKTVTNLETINVGGFAGTDTGGQTHFFFIDNPKYKLKPLHIGGSDELQMQYFSIDKADENSELIHYRAGSNWDNQSQAYYNEKYRRMIKKHLPELYDETKYVVPTVILTSRDREHDFIPNE